MAAVSNLLTSEEMFTRITGTTNIRYTYNNKKVSYAEEEY